MGDCQTEVSVYWAFCIISLILTFGLAIYRRKHNGFASNPDRGRKVFTSMAAVKIVIGALLITVLYPKDCVNFHSAYGAIAILIGLYWLALAKQLGNRQNEEMPVTGGNSKDIEAGTMS